MYQHGGDIYENKVTLDFSSNINPMGIPEGVIKAASKGVELSYRYPDTKCRELKKAISAKEGVPEEHIVCGNGAADLIFSLVLTNRPRKALLPAPTFHEYTQALNCVDCEINYHPLFAEDGFLLKENFIDKITAETDIIFLCNPNNPTGTLIAPDLQQRILKKCEECNTLLVADECFMDFVDQHELYTFSRLYAKSKNLFILKAFTKLYAMPGLRLGYGLSRDLKLLEKMKEVSQPWSVSVPAQMAGIAALKEEEYVTQSLNVISKEKDFLICELEKLNIRVYGSKANYIFFQADENLYKKCLDKGILIRNCSNYNGLGNGYYRIAVRTHDENSALIEVLKEG